MPKSLHMPTYLSSQNQSLTFTQFRSIWICRIRTRLSWCSRPDNPKLMVNWSKHSNFIANQSIFFCRSQAPSTPRLRRASPRWPTSSISLETTCKLLSYRLKVLLSRRNSWVTTMQPSRTVIPTLVYTTTHASISRRDSNTWIDHSRSWRSFVVRTTLTLLRST